MTLEWVTPHILRKTVATLISERADVADVLQELADSTRDPGSSR